MIISGASVYLVACVPNVNDTAFDVCVLSLAVPHITFATTVLKTMAAIL